MSSNYKQSNYQQPFLTHSFHWMANMKAGTEIVLRHQRQRIVELGDAVEQNENEIASMMEQLEDVRIELDIKNVQIAQLQQHNEFLVNENKQLEKDCKAVFWEMCDRNDETRDVVQCLEHKLVRKERQIKRRIYGHMEKRRIARNQLARSKKNQIAIKSEQQRDQLQKENQELKKEIQELSNYNLSSMQPRKKRKKRTSANS